MTARTLPPGPTGSFLLGHLSELRRDLLALYTRTAREFPNVALLRFGLRKVYVVSNPDLIDDVLSSRNYIKHYAVRMNRMLLGNGLLSSEGDFWLRQRRLIQPAFHRDRILSYGDTMVQYTHRWMKTVTDGHKFDIHTQMRQLTMEIAAKTLFGADAQGQGPAVARALQAVMESFIDRLFSILRLPESFPTPRNIRAWRAIRDLDAILYGLINQRREEGNKNDLISILMHARDEHGSGMTDQQLRDEAMTLFLAGHETTALALTYTLHLLAKHPEVQEELRREAREVAGDRPLTVDDLPLLKFAEMVVLEGMRLYPPAYAIGRQAVEAGELGGYYLPPGQTVLMVQWVLHRDPRFWDDPDRFYPRRWENGLIKRLPKGVYFPFGGGPRVCIGNIFAMIEATLILATIAQHWHVELGSEAPLTFRPRMTLGPGGPVELVFRKPGG